MLFEWVACVAATVIVAAPAVPQTGYHFPSDQVIRETARQAGTVSGKVGIVIGVLEADGTRRVVTVGDAPYDGRTLFKIGSITKVFTGILLAEMAERGDVRLEQPVGELLPGGVVVPSRNGRQIRLVDLSTTEPYVRLPAVMVAFAILGHIVIYRRLREPNQRPERTVELSYGFRRGPSC